MRISATGCSSPALARQRGFTLIELLVVLAILGVLSVAISVSMQGDQRRAASADIDRLALLLEAATIEVQAGQRQLAWSARDDGYTFWEVIDTREQRWQPVTEDERFRARTLTAGLHVDSIEIDGQVLPAGGLLVFRRGDPSLFRIRLGAPGSAEGSARLIELRALASGRVEVVTAAAS